MATTSTASTTTTTPSPLAKFLGGENPATTARTENDCDDIIIACAPKDRETLKQNNLKTYLLLQDQCKKGLTAKFKFHTFSELTEKNSLHEVSSTISLCNDLFRELEKRGMKDVFGIPEEMIFDTASNTWSPRSSSKVVQLQTEYSNQSLANVRNAVSWQNRLGPSYYVENNSWSETMILDSCEAPLRAKILEDLEKCPKLERGGPTAFFIMMKHIISTSSESLRSLLAQFQKAKLTDIAGENVLTAVTYIRNLHTLLKDNDMVPKDFDQTIFDFMSHSTCSEFVDHVNDIKGYIKAQLKTYTVDEYLKSFEDEYTSKLSSGKWTAKDTKQGQNSTFTANNGGNHDTSSIMCFNCGGLGHMIKDCPLPLDQAKIDARKKLMFGNREKKTST